MTWATMYHFTCDYPGCPAWEDRFGRTVTPIRRELSEIGWAYKGGKDLCPDHSGKFCGMHDGVFCTLKPGHHGDHEAKSGYRWLS